MLKRHEEINDFNIEIPKDVKGHTKSFKQGIGGFQTQKICVILPVTDAVTKSLTKFLRYLFYQSSNVLL